MSNELFNEELLQRYDTSVPRYTSYPTAPQFQPLSEQQYLGWISGSNEQAQPLPLSIYAHIPFCSTVCFYCACTKIITANRKHSEPYLDRLIREIRLIADHVDTSRTVEQMHWGGGTPTFLSRPQMQMLMDELRSHFEFADDKEAEISIELDPREVGPGDVSFLREQGFNRVSLGVQDIDPEVQTAVNRIQPFEQTLEVFNAARENNFSSISMDLIYGLPRQSAARFESTLEAIIETRPDRLSVFNYAHLPQRFKVQKQIDTTQLPSGREKLGILKMTIERLSEAGYVYIGMDHFSLPDDELALAQKNGSLQRNFQGYSTHRDCDLIGLGASSIGQVSGNYAQNYVQLEEYYQAVDAGILPVVRGLQPDADDILRRTVITRLICNFCVDTTAVSEQYDIDFGDYFSREIDHLRSMEGDGLVEIDDSEIRINTRGRLLVRNICSVFDAYLQASENNRGYSRAI